MLATIFFKKRVKALKVISVAFTDETVLTTDLMYTSNKKSFHKNLLTLRQGNSKFKNAKFFPLIAAALHSAWSNEALVCQIKGIFP